MRPWRPTATASLFSTDGAAGICHPAPSAGDCVSPPVFVRRSLNRAHPCALGKKRLIAVHILGCRAHLTEMGLSKAPTSLEIIHQLFPALVNVPRSVTFVLHRRLFNHSHADWSLPLFGYSSAHFVTAARKRRQLRSVKCRRPGANTYRGLADPENAICKRRAARRGHKTGSPADVLPT